MFFFYILKITASINTLHDKVIETANKKYWEVKKRIDNASTMNDVNPSDLKLVLDLQVILTEHYSIFRVGTLEIRKGGLLCAFIGFVLFCIISVFDLEDSFNKAFS